MGRERCKGRMERGRRAGGTEEGGWGLKSGGRGDRGLRREGGQRIEEGGGTED